MNITELDSYNLADAVKFHNRLNPKIWGPDEKLLPEVQQKLLEIAADFQEFLGIDDLAVEDITISGSNAAYSYTPHSDIDLHLVVRMPEEADEVYQELFNAKKYQYNDLMNIKIHGADVELYVQPADEAPVSLGEYSIKNSQWLQVPRRKRAKIDHSVVKHKYEDLKERIETALKENDSERVQTLIDKIKAMRQSGLDAHGEFGAENLAFKMLRSQGFIKKLYDHRAATRAHELSLKEQNKPRERFRWGFGEGHQGQPYSSEDGVSPGTHMFVSEDSSENIVQEFIKATAQRLGIERMPEIELHNDDAWSTEHHSFGMYVPDTHTLHVNLNDRHILDILRTTAHELAHCRQNEISKLPDDAGKTGSPWEDEAHAVAGEIMRDYADANPDMFSEGPVTENASGYIPKNKKEARDPRYSMAVTVDIKPGQVGKEANKLALHTGRNGEPALLMKSANLRESRMPQPSQGPGKYRDLNAPLGPEFKPTMPKGTVRVDVSDVYDWYKLGKDIPNLDRAKPSDYGKGPPSTIISFGDEDTEHEYIDNLKKLGLTTTDIDPVDPDQPKGMKRQKVDPTYNVAESLAQEFALFEEEDLMEIKMTGKNLSQLAKQIPGVMVGLEFEMIVPEVSNPDDEDDYGEMEADYDQDERVRDIDDAVRFFDDGDYNSSRDIRRLSENMYEDYRTWKEEAIDQEWRDNGFEFFQEYLDREEPFDPEDYQDRAEDEIKTEFPDLDPTSEDFGELVAEKLREINAEYYVETWESQGRSYDDAYSEFYDEQSDNFTESDWLENESIRYASDVAEKYDVQWPYYTRIGGNDGDGEEDMKRVALEFMNAMGYSSVAVSPSYHGSYEKWNGDRWVDVGRNKPNDCFSIEPDGSLDPQDSNEFGLEFVSPPIPLEQIDETMKKVQQWAGRNGVYTGKDAKTSIHTNISIPGYSLDKLDYLKAAILLGDEHVLREFERFGNTYAKPAIEKVRQLVKQNPEKAQALLDKMKNQLNAEASKLIHSGTTDKFTSINTKDNRIEFRSPGGDYLSIIADNPEKMTNTINRMVVAMDAALDPNKYKQEYQKKLYKLLSGQQFGREGATGKKQQAKADDKDLLNIFSRYAAGELPKAALKSFVRQAQLERGLAKGKAPAGQKYWWNVQWDANRRLEVVAGSKEVARQVAAEEWGVPESQLAIAKVTPLRPYKEPEAQPSAQSNTDAIRQAVGRNIAAQSAQNQGNWGIWIDANNRFANQPGEYARNETPPLRRFPSREAAEQWIEQQRAERPNMRTDIEVREIEPAVQNTGSATSGNWGVWVPSLDRYATIGNAGPRRFENRDGAEAWINDYNQRHAGNDLELQVREIEPAAQSGSRNALSQTDIENRLGWPDQTGDANYEVVDRQTNRPVFLFVANTDQDAQRKYAQYLDVMMLPHDTENFGFRQIAVPGSTMDLQRQRAAQYQSVPIPGVTDVELDIPLAQQPAVDAAQGGIVDVAGGQPAAGQFTGEWDVVMGGEVVFRVPGENQGIANNAARQWVLARSPEFLRAHQGQEVEVVPRYA